jgi:hypothetical protein
MALGNDGEIKRKSWGDYMNKDVDEYGWEDENADRLWYCPHGKAYGIRCKPCEEDDK